MTGDGDGPSDARRPEREAEASRVARESMLARHKLIEAMIDNNMRQLKFDSARCGADIERADVAWCGEFGTFVVVIALVVPEPVLARFERSDDRVSSLLPVLCCVPGQGIVAAADVAAGRTPPQVHPPTTGGITLGTANTAGRHRWVDGSSHRYSHSMVPGGLLVTSSTTRLTSATSLVIRVEIRSSTS